MDFFQYHVWNLQKRKIKEIENEQVMTFSNCSVFHWLFLYNLTLLVPKGPLYRLRFLPHFNTFFRIFCTFIKNNSTPRFYKIFLTKCTVKVCPFYRGFDTFWKYFCFQSTLRRFLRNFVTSEIIEIYITWVLTLQ